ncbi:hypothetical protein EHS43_24015 [Streptomyces sp. RP5T]|nr:hypothetical protein EHS43_24015 [Streptomyces sp. RP5T]
MAAGDETDAGVVTVCRFLALQALQRLTAPGAVSVNPLPGAPTLSFLVPADAARCWPPLPGTRGSCTEVVLPPDSKKVPPGPYWLIERSQGLTSPTTLRTALEAVARDVARRWPEAAAGPADLVGELWLPRSARPAAVGQDRVPRGRHW